MVRVPSIMLACGVVFLAVGSGCVHTKSATPTTPTMQPNVVANVPTPAPTSLQKMTTAMKSAVMPTHTPEPANEFACAWQNRLAQLPDPSKNGSLIPGLVGQMFVYTASYQPAEITGDLTIVVTDASNRPAGSVVPTPNVWHITQDKLKLMTAEDERFGRSVVLFLPWPEEWQDVSRIQIQARYDQPGQDTKYALPTNVTLDFSSPGTGQSAVIPGASAAGPSVPDPQLLLRQSRAVGLPPQPNGGIVPVAARVPQPALMTPNVGMPLMPSVQPQPKASVPAGGEFQRIVIPRGGAGS